MDNGTIGGIGNHLRMAALTFEIFLHQAKVDISIGLSRVALCRGQELQNFHVDYGWAREIGVLSQGMRFQPILTSYHIMKTSHTRKLLIWILRVSIR